MPEFFTQFLQWPDSKASMALLVLRSFVGFAFIQHSYIKTRNLTAFASKFKLSLPAAAAAAYIQLIGGAMLILGLLTPLAAISIAVTMVVAISKLKARGEKFLDPNGHSWESAGFYLAATIALMLLGPGVYSMDRFLFGK